MSYEEFDRHFSARRKCASLADIARSALPGALRATWQEEAFRSAVAANLKAGRFTLVIAVDQLTDELKTVVPYVNAHTVGEVRFLALEIGYVRDGDVEIVLPVTYGEESAIAKQAQPHEVWTREDYFEKLAAYGGDVAEFINALVGFSEQKGAQVTGGTGLQPSLNARFPFGNELKTVWSSYFYAGGPTFDLNFDYLRRVVPIDAMEESARIMRSIEGAEKRFTSLHTEFRSLPSLAVDGILTRPGAVQVVERALAALLPGAK